MPRLKSGARIAPRGDSQLNDPGLELAAIERDWARALASNDATAIGRFMTDQWTIVGPDGKVNDKATFLGWVRSGDLRHTVMEFTDLRIRVRGAVAIVTSRSLSEGTFRGQRFREVERSADVFVRDGATWRCASTHLSRIEQP